MTLRSILILILVSSVLDARESMPIPSSAYEKYPYNTVGWVTTDDGASSSAVAVNQRLVLSNASTFYQSFLEQWRFEPYQWFWKYSPSNLDNGVSARSWVTFADYASLVNEDINGELSDQASNKDIFLLQFQDDVSESVAEIAPNQLGVENYMMMVGYASGFYEFYKLERTRMHATRRGEASMMSFEINQFGDDEISPYRFYREENVKSAAGSNGSSLFSFIDGAWKLVGLKTWINPGAGLIFGIGIDDEIQQLITDSVPESSEEPPVSADNVYDASTDDVNGSISDGQILTDNRSFSGSIFPGGDNDYYQFTVAEVGSHSIQITASDIALGFEVFDSNGAVIFTSSIEANQFNTLSLPQVGDFAIRVFAQDGIATGEYQVELLQITRDETQFVDFEQTQLNPIPISVNNAYAAKLELPLATDYYVFQVTETSKVLINSRAAQDMGAVLFTVTPTASFPFTGTEIDEVIDVDEDSSENLDFLIDVVLEPGTYYLQIFSRDFIGTGVYNFQLVATPDLLGTPGGDLEGDDSFRSSFFSFFNRTYSQSLSKAGDIDYRSIITAEPGILTIETTGESDMFGVLYNANFNALYSDDNSGVGNNFRISEFVESGLYYIKMQGAGPNVTGDYSVSFDFVNNPDFWQGYVGLLNGDKTLPWFGSFNSIGNGIGWITHEQLGEVFVSGISVEDFDIWIPSTGLWFNTSSTRYPTLTTKSGGVEYRHVSGTTDPLQFERISDGVILEATNLIPQSFN